MRSVEIIFKFVNLLVIPFWGLLVFAPRWKWTQRLSGVMAPSLLSLFYVVLFLRQFPLQSESFGTLASVWELFSHRPILLAAWIHFLAFDLFLGAWEVRDAQRLGIGHLKVVPCLLLTFILGPLGFFSYMVLRWTTAKELEP